MARRKDRFQRTIDRAATDSVLRGLCHAITMGDKVAHGAFMDRCQELGLTVPNHAYWSFLMGGVVYRTLYAGKKE